MRWKEEFGRANDEYVISIRWRGEENEGEYKTLKVKWVMTVDMNAKDCDSEWYDLG